MAQAKVVEFLAAENPDVFVASVHPGVVMTDMGKDWMGTAKGNGMRKEDMDDGE